MADEDALGAAIGSVRDSIRKALADYERGKRNLPALLGEIKQLLQDFPEGGSKAATEWRQELLAALRGVGRAWSGGAAGQGAQATLSLDAEQGLHDALAALRRAVEPRN